MVFRLTTEKRFVQFGPDAKPGWIDQEVMVREDGVKLRLEGIGRERQRYFVYSDKDVSLDVRASRYDADGQELTDTWEIDLGLGLQKSAPDMSLDKVREIARNIEDALWAWPPGPWEAEKRMPVTHMKISMYGWRKWDRRLGDTL
jgi:hypothetical protein